MMRAWMTSLLLLPLALPAQEAILLNNPSFEDTPAHSKPPLRWYDCGRVGESPTDIHPGGFFMVETLPQDGRSYVGMVLRDNGSSEALGQRLPAPLAAGQCYRFAIYAARSDEYWSISRSTSMTTNFNRAGRLRIWGGFENCGREQLLAETEAVTALEWQRFELILRPQAAYTHLLLEAAYLNGPEQPYNGNLLLDNASALMPVDCGTPAPEHSALDTLYDPRLSASEDLSVFLAEQGMKVRFIATSDGLERHLFLDEEGRTQQINRHLWLMARALRHFPEQKLVVSIQGSSDFVIHERQQNFAYAFQSAGLRPEQFQILNYRRAHDRQEWLWPVGAHEYSLRLGHKGK